MNYEKLDVWKRSASLSATLYIELAELKDWGFKDQITRSGLSIPSNIAEGMVRESTKERQRLINIAQGSAAELCTQLMIGIKIGYVEQVSGRKILQEAKEISKMLAGLKDTLKLST